MSVSESLSKSALRRDVDDNLLCCLGRVLILSHHIVTMVQLSVKLQVKPGTISFNEENSPFNCGRWGHPRFSGARMWMAPSAPSARKLSGQIFVAKALTQ